VRNGASADLSTDKGDMTSATNNRVQVKKNDFLKFDYTLARNAFGGGSTSDWDTFTHLNLTITERQFAVFDGLRYYCDVVITYDILQTQSGEAAYDFIDFAKNGSVAVLEGSGVRIIGSDYYIAKRVKIIAYPDGATINWSAVATPP